MSGNSEGRDLLGFEERAAASLGSRSRRRFGVMFNPSFNLCLRTADSLVETIAFVKNRLRWDKLRRTGVGCSVLTPLQTDDLLGPCAGHKSQIADHGAAGCGGVFDLNCAALAGGDAGGAAV
jgi:hypothetical protein